jgi:hypothetical protein
MAAGPVVDQLATEYSAQNVVFIEYDVDNAPSSRSGRWWAAHGGGSVSLPLVMADSGYQFTNGYFGDFHTVYQTMVDNALARPAQADMAATWYRTGDKIHFTVQVTNLTGVTLSSSNSATVHAIVYEDYHEQYTDRFARAAVSNSITSLAPGAINSFELETGDLTSVVNWDNLHFIALVDYRPAGTSGPYDMIQAVVAQPLESFSVEPDTATFMVDPSDLSVSPVSVTISSPIASTWYASSDSPWISVTPSTGTMSTPAEISVTKGLLSPGWQQGIVTFTNADETLSDQVAVHAFLGSLFRLYLPVIRH